MSRVTIHEFCNDTDTCNPLDFETIEDVEIVPRKIVEKIITYCEEEQKIYSSRDEYDKGATAMALNVIVCAKDLLKLFEEGEQ